MLIQLRNMVHLPRFLLTPRKSVLKEDQLQRVQRGVDKNEADKHK